MHLMQKNGKKGINKFDQWTEAERGKEIELESSTQRG